jgi:hypothetical protein
MRLFTVLALLVVGLIAQAQVPTLISYQGRLTAGATNVEGQASLKCALVTSNGTLTLWSNDGTSTNGGEPASSFVVPVSQGLFTVLLGDTALSNMVAIPISVFQFSHVSLRLWVGDGVNGFVQLSPDQRIASVGFAMMAATVPDASITDAKLSSGAGISGMKIVPNFGSQDIVTSGSINARIINAASPPASCSAATAGRLYFNTALLKLFVCDGTQWIQLATVGTGDGSSPENAGTSCKAIKNASPAAASGVYWVDPDGPTGVSPFQCYCDMTADGGGWTLWGSMVAGGSVSTGLISTSSTNYMDQTRYAPLFSAANEFKASGATSGNQFFLSRSEAVTATCHSMNTSVPRFVNASLPVVYGHKESSGCDAAGGDFAYLGINSSGQLVVQSSGGLGLWHQNNAGGTTVVNSTTSESRVWLWLR